MADWKNLDTLNSFQELKKVKRVDLAKEMSGDNGAARVKNYSVPMAAGLAFNYASKEVDDDILDKLVALAEETQLKEKYEQEIFNAKRFFISVEN